MAACKDIPDDLVVRYARDWSDGAGPPVLEALVLAGFPEKVALRKIERLVGRGVLSYGSSPAYAFLAVV